MFQDLNNLLDLNPTHLANGLSIFVLEYDDADASFILHHFLSMYLQAGTQRMPTRSVAVLQSLQLCRLKAWRQPGEVQGVRTVCDSRGAQVYRNRYTSDGRETIESRNIMKLFIYL